nr:hypothetical protein [Tanacetum cinerariifolium]
MPKVLLIAWERFSEIKHAFTDKQYRPEEIQELMCKLLEDVRNINEFSEFTNSSSWDRPMIVNDKEHSIQFSDDESLSNEDVPMENFKIYSNPLFDNKIDPHYFNVESILIEYLPNRDTLFDSSPKFDYLEEFSELLSNDSIPLSENESSNFDHHDDPSYPRPPPEPPDVEIFFEPDSGVLTTNDKITSNFSENPMMMYGGDIPLLDVSYLHFYPP